MIERSVIERLCAAGVSAPSGDNSQPWSFLWKNEVLHVRCHPDKDHPLLNVEARGTYIATGALLENIAVAAQQEGLLANVELFPNEIDAAQVSFSSGGGEAHPLQTAIFARHSNRGAYSTTIPADLLRDFHGHKTECSIQIVTDTSSIRRISSAASTMEYVALHTRKIHYEFFRSMLWSTEANESGASGLYIRTTELPPPIQGLFRVIRHWPVMRALNAIGFPTLAAKSNAAVYAQSGAIVGVFVPDTSRESYIAAGRCMQHIWLTATSHGLAAQPLAGLIYLAEYVATSDDPEIPDSRKRRIRSAMTELESVFTSTNSMAMMLRVGTPKRQATARSARRKPVIQYEHE